MGDDNEILCAMEPLLRLRRFRKAIGLDEISVAVGRLCPEEKYSICAGKCY